MHLVCTQRLGFRTVKRRGIVPGGDYRFHIHTKGDLCMKKSHCNWKEMIMRASTIANRTASKFRRRTWMPKFPQFLWSTICSHSRQSPLNTLAHCQPHFPAPPAMLSVYRISSTAVCLVPLAVAHLQKNQHVNMTSSQQSTHNSGNKQKQK